MITLEDCKQAGEYNYKGLSTDTKPTNCAVNSLFLELDTGIFYFFTGTEWKDIKEKITLGETEPTGTISITNNGIFDVHDYAEADVNVPAITPAGTISITENGTYDVANYAEASVDVDATVNFNLPANLERTTPTALSQARDRLAATTVGNYALFGGGSFTSSPYFSDVVDAYDTSLTRTTPTELSQGRRELAATTVGNYAFFGGGYSYSAGVGFYYYATVDAYETTLTRTTPTELSQARNRLAATTVGNYALFGGGYNYDDVSSVVDAYDTSLTRTTPTALSQGRSSLSATTVAPAGGSSPQSGYALFGGGGAGSSYYSVVDAYDTSLTRTTPTKLSQVRAELAATTVAPAGGSSPQSGYALFGGGGEGTSYSSVVDAYDQNLTRTTPTELSQARFGLSATTVAHVGGPSPQIRYALFGGGYVNSSGPYSSTVDAYNTSLTRTNPTGLSEARYHLAATTVGNYALFGGGYDYSNIVDAYIPATYNIQVFPGTKYSFNGSTEQTSSTWQTISMQGEVVGYIKVKDANIT